MRIYILLLTAVPILFSILFLLSTRERYQKVLSVVFCLTATGLSILLAIGGEQKLEISGGLFHGIEAFVLISEILIILYLFMVSIKSKRWTVLGLAAVLSGLTIYSELFMKKPEALYLNVDKLSIVMALLINIIGTLIILFSNDYIKHYEESRNMKNKQKLYYLVVCIFLSSMNGLIFSDSLSFVYFFWEITTVCSFILISYNGDAEALNSGFRALILNLIGGACFSLGIILFKEMMNVDSLTQIISIGRYGAVYTLPVFLLCIAGFAKSAQMPFQSWLLKAMVAPTPVSALLHSSTMVKAGVYLILKLSPVYAGTKLGTIIALYGGVSFLLCSAIAVTQRNAKRVLAYSTIANLGLIISSAGMGTSIAISAAIMLVIFHAISKALMFLCAGQIEHVIGSRDIEDMAGLMAKAPMLTIITSIGILSMILPPFGVLITKWVSIEASASNPVIMVLLVLGSAFTTMFWLKWLGTILSNNAGEIKAKTKKSFSTYFPLTVLSISIIAASIFIAPIFNNFVSPQVNELLGSNNLLSINSGRISSELGSFNDATIFLVLIATVFIYFMVRKFILSPHIKKVYLCGENSAIAGAGARFRSGNGTSVKPQVSNFYLYGIIDEKKIVSLGYIVTILIIAAIVIGGAL